jgi:hypothetical protein
MIFIAFQMGAKSLPSLCAHPSLSKLLRHQTATYDFGLAQLLTPPNYGIVRARFAQRFGGFSWCFLQAPPLPNSVPQVAQ